MPMLGLSKFKWTYKAKQGKLPGFPSKPPAGYKPPKMFDPAREPGERGFRVGTVRDWEEGPHIKMREGWFPYDPDTKRIQKPDGSWVEVPGKKEKEIELPYPDGDMLIDASRMMSNVLLSVKEGDQPPSVFVDLAEEIVVSVTDKLKMLEKKAPSLSLSNKAKDALEGISGYLDPLFDTVDERNMDSLDALRDAVSKVILYQPLFELFNDANVHSIWKSKREKERKKRKQLGSLELGAKYRSGVFSVLSGDPKEVSVFGKQGFVSVTRKKTMKDGTEAIFKQDALGLPIDRLRSTLNPDIGCARRELAAFMLDDQAFGLGVVPPTIAKDEKLYDPDIILRAAKKAAGETEDISAVEYYEDLDPDGIYEGSTQLKIAGEDLETELKKSGADYYELREEDIPSMQRVAALHFLIGITDGHYANIFREKSSKKLYAIDNGFAFPNPIAEKVFDIIEVQSNAVLDLQGEIEKFDDDVIQAIDKIDENKVRSIMREIGFEQETDGVLIRLSLLKEKKTVPFMHEYHKKIRQYQEAI